MINKSQRHAVLHTSAAEHLVLQAVGQSPSCHPDISIKEMTLGKFKQKNCPPQSKKRLLHRKRKQKIQQQDATQSCNAVVNEIRAECSSDTKKYIIYIPQHMSTTNRKISHSSNLVPTVYGNEYRKKTKKYYWQVTSFKQDAI